MRRQVENSAFEERLDAPLGFQIVNLHFECDGIELAADPSGFIGPLLQAEDGKGANSSDGGPRSLRHSPR